MSHFKRACEIVDEAIRLDAARVSAEERNNRVAAVQHKLSRGFAIENIDPRARLTKIRFTIEEGERCAIDRPLEEMSVGVLGPQDALRLLEET